jgi:hypothetical protein
MIVATLATLSNSDQTPELAHDSEAIDEEARRRIEEPLINHAISGLKALTREPQSPSRPGSARAAFACEGGQSRGSRSFLAAWGHPQELIG